MSVLLGEFLGSVFLITLGCGVVANTVLAQSKGENAGWFGITTGWGIAVIIAIFVALSTGSPHADLNPAVSLGKYVLGVHTFEQMWRMMAAQFAGAYVGAVIVWLAYLPHWRLTRDAGKKLGVFANTPAVAHTPSNLLTEIIATLVLLLGIGAIFGSATQGQPAAGLGPYLVGILVWGIGLSLGGPTGYAINPARDLAPRLAHAILPIPGKGSSHWGYAWIPVVGPLIGGVIGAKVWMLLF